MSRDHPKNGVTLWLPKPDEAIVTAYGDFGSQDFARLLGDAYRVVERETGKRPDFGYLTISPGVIQVRVIG